MSLSFLLSLNVPTEHAHEIEYFFQVDKPTDKQLRFYTFPWKVKMFFGK